MLGMDRFLLETLAHSTETWCRCKHSLTKPAKIIRLLPYTLSKLNPNILRIFCNFFSSAKYKDFFPQHTFCSNFLLVARRLSNNFANFSKECSAGRVTSSVKLCCWLVIKAINMANFQGQSHQLQCSRSGQLQHRQTYIYTDHRYPLSHSADNQYTMYVLKISRGQ